MMGGKYEGRYRRIGRRGETEVKRKGEVCKHCFSQNHLKAQNTVGFPYLWCFSNASICIAHQYLKNEHVFLHQHDHITN